MEVIIQPDPQAASLVAARIVARLVGEKPAAVLGLATGSTPIPLYRELVRLHREEALDFSGVRTFNLDEYVGLGPEHPASYSRFLYDHLLDEINIAPHRVHFADGLAADIPSFCGAYEAAIRRAGGIDLQVLGLGTDGHIGFNEPTSSLASRTRIKSLTRATRDANRRFFDNPEDVPHHVITMGVGTILDSRACLLLAFGREKAEAIRAVVEGPVTAMVPGSALQLHQHVYILVDEAAASALERHEYYRWVYANKPAWQQYG